MIKDLIVNQKFVSDSMVSFNFNQSLYYLSNNTFACSQRSDLIDKKIFQSKFNDSTNLWVCDGLLAGETYEILLFAQSYSKTVFEVTTGIFA